MAPTVRVALCWWLLVSLLTACSWDAREPGLFGRETETPPPPTQPTASATNPELPVVGEAMWVGGDAFDLSVRIAVHAVRRIAGATVLDWSLTPVSGAGLEPGDPVPSYVDLGLDQPATDAPSITLVAPGRGQVLRPLTTPTTPTTVRACVCTPPSSVQQLLRMGETRLLQVSFPALPQDVHLVDVDIVSVPLFANVAVTPTGTVASASNPVDLTRPAALTPPVVSTAPFTSRASGQQFSIDLDTVYTAATFTSLVWTIRSVTAGPGLSAVNGPPFGETHPRYGPGPAAGGPTLTPAGGGAVLRSRLLTDRLAGRVRVQCQCTDLRRPNGSLRLAARQLTVVTNFAPLPEGARTVDVDFPGVGRFTRVPTVASSDGSLRAAAPVRRQVSTYRDPPPDGWPVRDWPTPLPAPARISAADATVDTFVR